jgi:tyrosinase
MNKAKSQSKDKEMPEPKPFVSKPLHLDIRRLENPFKRADIEFYGIDHSGSSYEGRVFLNNPEAKQSTAKAPAKGYVGSFYIFGHGGCFGDIGHCEIHGDRRPYDYRPSHPLTPAYKRIIATDKIRQLGKNTSEFTITIVPVLAKGTIATDEVVKLERISIITYD